MTVRPRLCIGAGTAAEQKGHRRTAAGRPDARELWTMLRTRLLTLTRMQLQWGKLHDIYEPVTTSRFTEVSPGLGHIFALYHRSSTSYHIF